MLRLLRKIAFRLNTLLKVVLMPIYSFEGLERYYRAYLEREPADCFARWALAELYSVNAKYVEAKQEFETLLKYGHKEPSILKALGEMCYRLGDYSEAIRCFEQVEWRHSNDKYFNINLGTSYVYNQAYEKAIPRLIRAETLSLKSSQTYEMVGFCFFQLGSYEQSAEWYQRALSLNPSSPLEVRNNVARARVHLANALLREGKRTDAVSQFHSALEMKPEDSIVQAISTTLAALENK